MARYEPRQEHAVAFKDIAAFTEGSSNLELIDIINDASKEKISDNYINAPGAYVYELDITVDQQKVIDHEVLGFKVEIFSKNPNIRFNEDYSVSRATMAKERKNRLREFIETRQPDPVLEFDIDLNVPLPPQNFNFTTAALKAVPKILPVFLNSEPQTSGKMVTAPIVAMPIITPALGIKATPKSSPSTNLIKGNTFANIAKLSITHDKKDPISLMATPKPFYPTLAAKTSFASIDVFSPPPKDYSQIERISLDNIYTRRSLIEERQALKPQQEDESKGAYKLANIVSNNTFLKREITLGHKAEIKTTAFTVKREIEIPKLDLGMRSSFYVSITPILRESNAIVRVIKTPKSHTFSVSHRRQVEDIMLPVYPPEISLVMNKRGIVVLKIKQADPSATLIDVFRKVVSPRKDGISSSRAIASIESEASSPSQIVSDFDSENIFPNSVIYRATTRSPIGLDGPSSSLVIDSHHNINAPTAKEDPNALSIIAVNENEHIKIDVERIPQNILGLKLLREEIDESGSLSKRVTTVPMSNGKTLYDTKRGIKKLTYFDKTTDLNKRYRYFCTFRPRLGNEYLSEEDEHIIRKMPTKPLPVEVSIQNQQITTDDSGQFIMSIDLISIPKAEGVDFLLTLLERAGVSQAFISSIKDQRAELSQLAAFIVERVNRNTGKRVSFGQVGPGTFSDDPETRERLGIPAPSSNNRYTYFFKLCMRPPQAFLKSLLTSFPSGKIPGVDDTTALAKKFLGAFAAQTGALYSDKEMSDFSVGDNFRAGETGITLHTDIQTPKPLPKPVGLRIARRSRKRGILLKWESDTNDIRQVDHVLVFVLMQDGTEILLGTRPGSYSGGWYFKDTKYAPQVGKKKYYVKFVYNDLTVSAPSNSVVFEIFASLPPAFFNFKFKPSILGVVNPTAKKQDQLKMPATGLKLKLPDLSKKVNASGWNINPGKFKKKLY